MTLTDVSCYVHKKFFTDGEGSRESGNSNPLPGKNVKSSRANRRKNINIVKSRTR